MSSPSITATPPADPNAHATDEAFWKHAIVDRNPRYTLADLVAQCDASVPMTEETRAWLAAEPVGRELPDE